MKSQVSQIEKNMWKNIPFEYKGMGYKFKYSLSDALRLNEDSLEVGIISELYGVDHGDFKEELRKIKPIFSEDPSFA
jgi:hypothetical protein